MGLSIADVVGKGIPAALLMSNLQAAVRAFATDAAQPAELCQQVNRILCGRIAEDRFISFFYCVMDWELGLLTFANAGHHAPILVRADGRVERLAAGGPVLGVFPDAVTGSTGSRSAPAIASCSSPTASAKRKTPAIRSSARTAWSISRANTVPAVRRRSRRGSARPCRPSPTAASTTTPR